MATETKAPPENDKASDIRMIIKLLRAINIMCDVAGFTVTKHIELKNKKTGEEYK